MKTSFQWFQHFQYNLTIQRIDWQQRPQITMQERKVILQSLKAWQLGETSDGKNLIKASTKYANKRDDAFYVEAVKLFIKEEQKHGENLGRYVDRIGAQRIKKDWGDSLFRWFRYFNNSMELWTLTVLTVESTAQIFYQSLKDATGCSLLKQICTDILIDEAPHIEFQRQRMAIIFNSKKGWMKGISLSIYKVFYFATALVVWTAHRKVFIAGGNGLQKFMKKMKHKYQRNFTNYLPQYTFYQQSLSITQS